MATGTHLTPYYGNPQARDLCVGTINPCTDSDSCNSGGARPVT